MRGIGSLQAIWMSFYSPKPYVASATSWKGLGLLYLAALLAISWLPSSFRWFTGLRQFATTTGQALVEQLPAIRIQNGVMSATPPGRHVIRDESDKSGDSTIAIIDDTVDEVPSDVLTDTFFLARREFGAIRPSRSERRIWQLSPSTDMDVSPDEVQRFFNSIPFWIPPLGYLACLAGSFAFRTLQILLYGSIGQAFAKQMNVSLDFNSLVRLSVVAITPVIVLRTLIWFAPSEPAWYIRWPVALAISLAYLSFGVRAVAAARVES